MIVAVNNLIISYLGKRRAPLLRDGHDLRGLGSRRRQTVIMWHHPVLVM
jgi:hypothetical protein